MKFHHLQTVFEIFFVVLALVNRPTQPQEPNEFWAQDTLNLSFSIILVNKRQIVISTNFETDSYETTECVQSGQGCAIISQVQLPRV